MIEVFELPDLAEGLVEAELVQWVVAVGDAIELNQTIAEVETAKASVELPSPFAGVITELHAQPGDIVPVGSVLVSIETGAPGDAPVAGPPPAEQPATEAEEELPPNLVGYGAAAKSTGKRPSRRRRAPNSGSEAPSRTAAPPSAANSVVRAENGPRPSPLVRKLAKDKGVDLALVTPSSPSGRITRADLEAYLAQTSPNSGNGEPSRTGTTPSGAVSGVRAPAAWEPGEQRIPIRGVRKYTAEAMVRSAFTAPHASTFVTVDVTATMEFIRQLKTDRSLAGHRIGILALAARAVCLALGKTPELNSRWDEAAGEIVIPSEVNLGIAAATERGLVVPNIRGAQRMSAVELADAITELTETARVGKTPPAAMMGGTFTITNIGVFGVDAGTPILNPGEAGILALGAVRKQPWEYEGEMALRDILTLSLSFDHRLVDGAQGATFLRDVADLLAQPGRALLYS